MPPVSIFLNIVWLLLGGVWMAAGWVVAAVIMALTIIGLPWARAAFNIAAYTLLPFGQRAVRRDMTAGQARLICSTSSTAHNSPVERRARAIAAKTRATTSTTNMFATS